MTRAAMRAGRLRYENADADEPRPDRITRYPQLTTRYYFFKFFSASFML